VKAKDSNYIGAIDVGVDIIADPCSSRDLGRTYASELHDLLNLSRGLSRKLCIFWSLFISVFCVTHVREIIQEVTNSSLWVLEPCVMLLIRALVWCLVIAACWFVWMAPILVRRSLLLYLSGWEHLLAVPANNTSDEAEWSSAVAHIRRRVYPSIRALRVQETKLVRSMEEFDWKCDFYIGLCFLFIVLHICQAFIALILMSRGLEEATALHPLGKYVVIQTAVMFLFLLTLIFRVLIHMASVGETFCSLSRKVFRGYPSWNLSNVLGGDPLLLQSYMENLEPVLAFHLMGVPMSYSIVHTLISSVLVGLLFTIVVPLLPLSERM